jgi:hypothetical protein
LCAIALLPGKETVQSEQRIINAKAELQTYLGLNENITMEV